MFNNYLLAIVCPDWPGLISSITARLFDLGINLGDANFSILGEGAEFFAVLEVPENLVLDNIKQDLAALPELSQADISIKPFAFNTLRGESSNNTHHIIVEGNDQPGLVARLTELLSDYDSNIVRMDTRKLSNADNLSYVIDLWACIPAERAEACLAAINNTAASLGMNCTASDQT